MKYEVRASKVENGTGNVVGMATIVIEDKFAVGNIRILQKEEGELSVMYPARKSAKEESGYKNIAHPYTSELYYMLKEAIIAAYNSGEHSVVNTEAQFKLETKVNLYDKDSLKAFCHVKFSEENEFAINDITIRKGEGKEDVFVAMPTYKKNDGEFGQICNPITAEFREELCGALLSQYNENIEKKQSKTTDNNQDKTENEDKPENEKKTEKKKESTEEAPDGQLKATYSHPPKKSSR